MEPMVRVEGLTKVFGKGCHECLVLTGPEHGGNLCT